MMMDTAHRDRHRAAEVGRARAARESVLIEKLNVKAADGTFAWDQATPPAAPRRRGRRAHADEQKLVQTLIKVDGPRRAVSTRDRTFTATPLVADETEEA